MNVTVTGGAGFIGSHVVDELLTRGHKVTVLDNFRTGRREFLRDQSNVHPIVLKREGLYTIDGNILDTETCLRAFDGADWVIHMAANADVRHGLERPFFDIEQNVLGTAHVLDAMRVTGVHRIFFASTASVYGSLQMDRIPEDAPFPAQNSLYGASKVAAEGLCSAYAEGFGFTSIVGRWVQVMGPRYLHGHIIDFVRKLRLDPDNLHILGDGNQAKSGVHAADLARGIVDAIADATHAQEGTHLPVNFGTDQTFTVNESADLICGLLNVRPFRTYSGRTNGGWVGDNPRVLLDTKRAQDWLGWKPEWDIPSAITDTVQWLLSEECTYL